MSCFEPKLKKKKINKMDTALKEMSDYSDLPSSQELTEMCMSPDPFQDSVQLETAAHVGGGDQREEIEKNVLKSDEVQEVLSTNVPNLEEKTTTIKAECGGGESSFAGQESELIPWKGCPLSELQKGPNLYGMPQLHPIKPSANHTVVFQVGTLKKEPSTDAWDSDHVRMPCSSQNRYPVGDSLKPRWNMIKSALQKPIKNSKELQAAIMSYNHKYAQRWDFSGLHHFFNEDIEEEEVECFFSVLLPQMVKLALQLPVLLTRPLPLLRRHQTRSISLTQQQVACLLANAFFCTFPRRNASKQASEYSTFPDINFNRLFQGQKKKSYMQRTNEKLKCILHYFRRVCHSCPTGNVTFTRRYISGNNFPVWDRSGHFFRKLHISSEGTIEDNGKGMLQVDFANKMVGGGVLGWGCVQEEIRFVICPELIVARLFTECLDATEALLITGCEQYSTQEGYADNFSWNGDYQDETPSDPSGRKLCSVIAIDALYLRYPAQQFTVNSLTRELNKAYVGFYNPEVTPENIAAVATGNWGCGVYRGNTRLKALLQLMAAAQAGRALAYFTFGDTQLRDDVHQMHRFLVCNRATVGLLWRHLCKYYEQCYRNGTFLVDLYEYLYKSMDPTGNAKNNLAKGRNKAVSSPPKMKPASSVISTPKPIARSPSKVDAENEESSNDSSAKDTQDSPIKTCLAVISEKQNVTVDKVNKVDTIDIVDTVDKVDKGGTIDKVDKGGTIDKVDKGGTIDKVDKGGTIDKVDKGVTVDKVDKSDTVYRGGTVDKVDTIDKVHKVDTIDKVDSVRKDDKVDKIDKVDNVSCKSATCRTTVGASKNIFKKPPSPHPVPSQIKLRSNPLNILWESKSAVNRLDTSPTAPRVSSPPVRSLSGSPTSSRIKEEASSSNLLVSSWLNNHEKETPPIPQTIQKRVSDYFYEINVPK